MNLTGARILWVAARTAVLTVLFCCVPFAFSFAQQEIIQSESLNQAAPIVESDRLPQRRPPPRVAVEACQGKKEGDLCSFTDTEGVRKGECLSGREKIFGCRPFKDDVSRESQKESAVRGDAKEIPVIHQDTKAPQSGTGPAGKSAINPSESKSPTSANPLKEAQPVTQLQTAPVVSTETPSSQPERRSYDIIVESPWTYFGVALLSVTLTWYAFFRYSTIPLRRLRKVTQQLAGGDLSARVGEGLVHRKDEVADLARDVDRMAERIESLVGAHQRLIRDVSHELRSPLARLNVALELARQSAGLENPAPFDRIERESERLNELIGQLLMLTKLESDSGMSQRGELDISGILNEVAQDVDFEAKSNDRRVIVKSSETLLLNGNRELLRQALENLVRNAARYTQAGTEVEISLRKKESGGRKWAHIEVRDHGPGVPESVLYDIFRPFYRVSDSRERQSGGTGVGLAISDRAVRLHGGSLRAFNAPGGGLIMEMELPLA